MIECVKIEEYDRKITGGTFRRFVMLLVTFLSGLFIASDAQIFDLPHRGDSVSADSARREFDQMPYFGLYRDNYFIFGPPIGYKPTRDNTNVKFQISIRQKLTKSTLPWDTYLYLFYTQRVVWDVLQKSLPMEDLSFNPGIGLAKPLFHGGKYIGRVTLAIEHESNGRDSIWSRSWNRVSLGGDVLLTRNVLLHGKVWIPYIDGEHNRDLLRYVGIGQIGVELMSDDRRWRGSVIFVKRKSWTPDFNTVLELAWQFSKKADWCLFLQYYNGYGETLLYYNRYISQLRAGIVIKPAYFSDH